VAGNFEKFWVLCGSKQGPRFTAHVSLWTLMGCGGLSTAGNQTHLLLFSARQSIRRCRPAGAIRFVFSQILAQLQQRHRTWPLACQGLQSSCGAHGPHDTEQKATVAHTAMGSLPAQIVFATADPHENGPN